MIQRTEGMVCSSCGEEKSIDNFEFRSDTKKYRRQCYKCNKGYERTRNKIREDRLSLLSEGLKKCNQCKQVKPIDQFFIDRGNKLTGLSSGCKSCRLIYQNNNKHFAKNYAINSKYGITLEDFNAILNEQDNKCPICGKELKGRNAHTDHCHTTGKVRGILCCQCNQAIGLFKEDTEAMFKAIQYLKIINGKIR